MTVEQLEMACGEMTDRKLVERAKCGDQEAFGDLVRRHRAKAYGFAMNASRKHEIADEIVQEALIQAFLKLGSLMEDSKFEGWFHAIVRNQIHMKLRRGGPYRKERPVTSLVRERELDSFEAILSHLSYRIENSEELNPEIKLMKQETIHGIKEMLSCLSSKERDIFIAFFFKELTPQEIAAMYETTTSSVYNHLSRSKRKLRHEQIRVRINEHIQIRRKQGKPRRKVLDISKM